MSAKPKRRLKAWIYFPLSLVIAALASLVFVLIFRDQEPTSSNVLSVIATATPAGENVIDLSATASSATASSATISGATRIFRYKENGFWGYKDQAGTVLVVAKYKAATDFSEGYAWVASADTGKYGLIDDQTFDVNGPRGGFIYDDVRGFHEGVAAVKREETWGYANNTGALQKQAIYTAAWDYNDGYARVSKGEEYYYIDAEENAISEKKYDSAQDFSAVSSGLVAFVGQKDADSNNKMSYFLISPTTEIRGIGAVVGTVFSEDLAAVQLASGLYTYYDSFGNEAMSKSFEIAQNFQEGLAAVKENGKWGYINTSGAFEINTLYDDAKPFSENYAAVNNGTGWFFIDKNNQRVMPQQENTYYTSADSFQGGYARVVIGDTVICIDSQGTGVELYKADPADLLVSRSAVIRTSGDALNMRAQPDATSAIMLRVPNNADITVLEETTNGWCYIQYGDTKGYVSKRFVLVEDNTV